MKIQEVMITVTTQLKFYLNHPYTIDGLSRMYLGSYLTPATTPKVAHFIHHLHFPPTLPAVVFKSKLVKKARLPVTPSTSIISPSSRSKVSPPAYTDVQLQDNSSAFKAVPEPSTLKYTDIRLRDSPSLVAEWAELNTAQLPKSSNSATKWAAPATAVAAQMSTSRLITPLLELEVPHPMTPSLNMDVDIAPKPVIPSLLDLKLQIPTFQQQHQYVFHLYCL